jgi:DNA-binding GntR family transcriptional regulator
MDGMQDLLVPGQRPRDILEEEIASGVLPPGARLDEQELARRFGVSRTPVREAIQQLAAAGFVEQRPRRGAVVARFGPERLYEMFEVMAELEAMAGRLAARRLTPADRTLLLDTHARCGAARGSSDAYYAENEAFHQVIYRASGNAFLVEQCELLQRRLRPYRRLQLRYRNRVAASYTEHDAIVSALLVGDGDLAARLLRQHVAVQGERFADLVASLARLVA